MTSKEQERKALAQIKKIVAGLGEDSYIATAFEGCFEIAEQNIENDWACSMKQRVDAADKKAIELQDRIYRLENAVSVNKTQRENAENEAQYLKGIIKEKNGRIQELEAALETANTSTACQVEEREMADAKIEELQGEIIKLKAKLYDLMTA